MTGGGLRALLRRLRGTSFEIKSRGQLDAMSAAGALVARTLAQISQAARPGMSTGHLDELAEQTIRDAGGVPSFLGYHGFPASICASLNHQVVHGIPDRGTVLADGDLLSVDCGAVLDGWHGDAAVTIAIGRASEPDHKLSAACRAALDAGIAAARAGSRLGDIAHAVQTTVQQAAATDGVGYGIVPDYGGHGIGTAMHMNPFVPNVGKPGRGARLVEGMVLAIEPMTTLGSERTVELDDGWTVVTADGARSAHWEHSVAITEHGPVVLTSG